VSKGSFKAAELVQGGAWLAAMLAAVYESHTQASLACGVQLRLGPQLRMESHTSS